MVCIPQGPEIYGIKLSILEPEKKPEHRTPVPPPSKKMFSSKVNDLGDSELLPAPPGKIGALPRSLEKGQASYTTLD